MLNEISNIAILIFIALWKQNLPALNNMHHYV
jgi:hypothetical protein